jgi:hypothetical protein
MLEFYHFKSYISRPDPILLMQLNLNTMKHKLPFAPFNIFGMIANKPTIAYLNNFSKLHIYDIKFGPDEPVRVIPHDLLDQVLIWPAPPAKGGVEVYFSAMLDSWKITFLINFKVIL